MVVLKREEQCEDDTSVQSSVPSSKQDSKEFVLMKNLKRNRSRIGIMGNRICGERWDCVRFLPDLMYIGIKDAITWHHKRYADVVVVVLVVCCRVDGCGVTIRWTE